MIKTAALNTISKSQSVHSVPTVPSNQRGSVNVQTGLSATAERQRQPNQTSMVPGLPTEIILFHTQLFSLAISKWSWSRLYAFKAVRKCKASKARLLVSTKVKPGYHFSDLIKIFKCSTCQVLVLTAGKSHITKICWKQMRALFTDVFWAAIISKYY